MPARRPARRQSSSRRRTADPTRLLDLDSSRFLAFRAGVSIPEIAARENSTTSAVEASISRQKILRETFSQESLEHTYRRGAIEAHSAVQSAILQALGATITQIREVGVDDAGKPVTEIFTFADHKTRMQAIDRLNALVTSIQAQAPLLSLTQNTLNQQNLQLAAGQVSFESIAREVRLEKGLTQAMEQPLLEAEAEESADLVDFELEQELAVARAQGEVIEDEILEGTDSTEDAAPEE
jgi:hypothetical protein